MSATAPAIQGIPALDLAGLRQMDFKQLDELYRAGKRPATISDLNGDAKGAMLAWRAPARGPVACCCGSSELRRCSRGRASRSRVRVTIWAKASTASISSRK